MKLSNQVSSLERALRNFESFYSLQVELCVFMAEWRNPVGLVMYNKEYQIKEFTISLKTVSVMA